MCEGSKITHEKLNWRNVSAFSRSKKREKGFYVQQTNSKPNFLNLSHASDFCAWKIISVFHKIYLIKSIKHE